MVVARTVRSGLARSGVNFGPASVRRRRAYAVIAARRSSVGVSSVSQPSSLAVAPTSFPVTASTRQAVARARGSGRSSQPRTSAEKSTVGRPRAVATQASAKVALAGSSRSANSASAAEPAWMSTASNFIRAAGLSPAFVASARRRARESASPIVV